MKILALIALMSIAHHRVDYDQKVISDIREGFFVAAQESDKRLAYIETLESASIANSTFAKAYLGAALTMYAECEFTPWSKYSYFKDGTRMLETAIEKEPDNPEFRYLRFLIQSQTPAFLNYSDNIESDFAFLKEFINSNRNEESAWVGYFIEFVENRIDDKKFNLNPGA